MTCRHIMLLGLFIFTFIRPVCLVPLPGENLWRLVARIGACLDKIEDTVVSVSDALTTDIAGVDTDLLSVSDVLCSKIMEIDRANDVLLLSVSDALTTAIAGVDSDLLSVSDVLCSKIMEIDRANDVLLLSVSDVLTTAIAGVDSDLLSVSDVLCSKIVAIDSANDVLLLSVSDVVTTAIAGVDTDLLSISDVLCSKIMAIDAANDELLLSVSDSLTTNITNVETDVLSVGDVLCSKLALLVEDLTCLEGTPITAADIPYTISSPGLYRLCENISTGVDGALITIASTDVTLDLYGRSLANSDDRCIEVSPGAFNIVIKNGFLTPAAEGIFFNNATAVNCVIQDIIIKNGTDGISLDASGVMTIKDCQFLTNSGIKAVNSGEIVIQNCNYFNAGIDLGNVGGAVIESCNNVNSITITDGAYDIKIVNCFVVGSYNIDASGIELVGCSADNNFSLNTDLRCVVRNCIASAPDVTAFNSTGTGVYEFDNCFVGTAGTGFNTSSVAQYRDCTAISDTGFQTSSPRVKYFNCMADALVGFEINADTCIVDGCDITSSTGGVHRGVKLNGNNLIVNNCRATRAAIGFEVTAVTGAVLVDCVADSCSTGFDLAGNVTMLEACIANSSAGNGFTISGSNVALKGCTASNNGSMGFDILSTGCVIKDSLATLNISSGINDNGNAATILDTRSYVNGAGDVLGASTVVTY